MLRAPDREGEGEKDDQQELKARMDQSCRIHVKVLFLLCNP